jgi:hypothetical protein
MQTNKTILLLLSVLLVFVGLFYAQRYIVNRQTDVDAYTLFFKGVTPDLITTMEIRENQQSLVFEKLGTDQWNVGTSSADMTKVKALLEILNPTNASLISENATTMESLGVSSSSATLAVTYPGGTKLVHLGNSTSDGRYINLDKNDYVYLVKNLPEPIDSTMESNWVTKSQ